MYNTLEVGCAQSAATCVLMTVLMMNSHLLDFVLLTSDRHYYHTLNDTMHNGKNANVRFNLILSQSPCAAQ